MRINCADCGGVHDSTVTPFMHDIVPDVKGNVDHSVKEKHQDGEFVCKHCGKTNYIELTWYTGWTWEDRKNENKHKN
jgi:hypothetical protein